MLKFRMLPARQGDCLWLEYGSGDQTFRVLVDGGVKKTYADELKPRLEAVAETPVEFELLVLTHIDLDHIAGAVEAVADSATATFGEVWFNGWHQLPGFLGVKDAIRFTDRIEAEGLAWNASFGGDAVSVNPEADLPVVQLPGGMVLTVLSPTSDELKKLKPVWDRELKDSGLLSEWRRRFLSAGDEGDSSESMDIDELAEEPFKKDTSIPNGSSIGLLAEWDTHRVLLAGDAYSSVLQDSIQQLNRKEGQDRLHLDAFKVAHHGSAKNLSNELLRQIDCRDYLFSTNGRHDHPDRKAIARILKNGQPSSGEPIRLIFNYPYVGDVSPDVGEVRPSSVWDDPDLCERYNYEVVYADSDKSGVELTIG